MLHALLPLLVLLPPASSTWTVDDDGPADFSSIADAVAAADPGDVLLVEPGEYAGFTLDKRLSLLGRALGRAVGERPLVTGPVTVSAPGFTLAGFDLAGLSIEEVTGRGRIDDCRINVVADTQQEFALAVDRCAQLVVSRVEAQGSEAYSHAEGWAGPGGTAMGVSTSHVTLVDCRLTGAQGGTVVGSNNGGEGGMGLFIERQSHVVIAGSIIEGGWEGFSGCFFCECHDGPSGIGIRVADSALVIRGSQGDSVLGGPADTWCPPAIPGFDISATRSTVVASGAFVGAHSSWVDTQLVEPSPAQPYVEVIGSDAPGEFRQVLIYGPVGAAGLLAASLVPAHVPVGAFEGALWFNPTSPFILVPLVLAGQGNPVTLNWSVPASTVGIEGLVIELQPFFPGISGALDPMKLLAGNVAELIVRF